MCFTETGTAVNTKRVHCPCGGMRYGYSGGVRKFVRISYDKVSKEKSLFPKVKEVFLLFRLFSRL
jgi:hypothetical protein